jgi:hypothetical protein
MRMILEMLRQSDAKQTRRFCPTRSGSSAHFNRNLRKGASTMLPGDSVGFGADEEPYSRHAAYNVCI